MFDFDEFIEDPNDEEIEFNDGIDKEECYRCYGTGRLNFTDDEYQCPLCHGTGFVTL